MNAVILQGEENGIVYEKGAQHSW